MDLIRTVCITCGEPYSTSDTDIRICYDCSKGGATTSKPKFEIPEPSQGDLTYPKGFIKHNLSAVELEAYCLGYDQCQKDTKTCIGDIVQEVIRLRSEVNEYRRANKSKIQRLNSMRMEGRKSHLKRIARQRLTSSMVNIKPTPTGKFVVDVVVDRVRHKQVFDCLEAAMDFRDSKKLNGKKSPAKASSLTDEQLSILEQARVIRQTMLTDADEDSRRRKLGHNLAKYNKKNKNA